MLDLKSYTEQQSAYTEQQSKRHLVTVKKIFKNCSELLKSKRKRQISGQNAHWLVMYLKQNFHFTARDLQVDLGGVEIVQFCCTNITVLHNT